MKENKTNTAQNHGEHKVDNPFDSLFKSFMSNPIRAKDFLALFLPKRIWSLLKHSAFTLCPQSMVDNKLKHKHVDVLYRTQFNDAPGYIYFLSEQQTNPDKNMPLRIWQYILRIIELHQKQFNTEEFPIIYPIVFYVGKKHYPYSTDFFDGFGEHKDLAKSILTQPFPVADVVGVTDEELDAHPLAGALSRIYQIAYARDIITELKKLAPQIQYLDIQGNSDFIVSMLYFALDRTQNDDADNIIEAIQTMVSNRTGSDIMTALQQLENRGIEKGMQQGMQQGMEKGIQFEKCEIAKKLLAKQMPVELIAEATDLGIESVNKLKNDLDSTRH